MASKMKRYKKYTIIGVDEAGRGPLAGSVSVAAVSMEIKTKDRNISYTKYVSLMKKDPGLKKIRDSKKLTPNQRNQWLKTLKDNFDYSVCMVGPQIIDKIGIQRATRMAVRRSLRRLVGNLSREPHLVFLDGLLFAPDRYSQQTVIKGDEKVPLISAASIVAKVHRDRKMEKLHDLYPDYCFNCHKGYGTRLHYKRIKKFGPSPFHRHTYLKNI
jgi:ribonuclease HII